MIVICNLKLKINKIVWEDNIELKHYSAFLNSAVIIFHVKQKNVYHTNPLQTGDIYVKIKISYLLLPSIPDPSQLNDFHR